MKILKCSTTQINFYFRRIFVFIGWKHIFARSNVVHRCIVRRNRTDCVAIQEPLNRTNFSSSGHIKLFLWLVCIIVRVVLRSEDTFGCRFHSLSRALEKHIKSIKISPRLALAGVCFMCIATPRLFSSFWEHVMSWKEHWSDQISGVCDLCVSYPKRGASLGKNWLRSKQYH